MCHAHPSHIFLASPVKVETLLAESSSGGKYVQKSTKLEPMNGRQRWLMYEFVGSSTADIKLCNLPGPAHARPMEVSSGESRCAITSL